MASFSYQFPGSMHDPVWQVGGDPGVATLTFPALTSLTLTTSQESNPQWQQYGYLEHQHQQPESPHQTPARRLHGYHLHPSQHHPYHHMYHHHHLQPPHPGSIARRNERERNRVKTINGTFAKLRQHLPTPGKAKKLSKVQILKSAIQYIHQLQGILESQDEEHADQTAAQSSKDPEERVASPCEAESRVSASDPEMSPEDGDLSLQRRSQRLLYDDDSSRSATRSQTSLASPLSSGCASLSEASERGSVAGDEGEDDVDFLQDLAEWIE